MQRTGGVTALAIILIIVGSLGIIANVVSFIITSIIMPLALINTIIYLLLSIGWLISGIGILGLRNWSRILVLTLAFIAIAHQIVMVILNFVIVGATSTIIPGLGLAAIPVFIIVLVISLAFPVLLTVFFTRPTVVEQFTGYRSEELEENFETEERFVIGEEEDMATSSNRRGPRNAPADEPKVAWLVIKSGREINKEFKLEGHDVKIGRDDSNDIVLDDSSVTHEHAKLFMDNGKWFIQDVGSLNGTYLNKHKVLKHDLMDNDKIQLGNTTLVFKLT